MEPIAISSYHIYLPKAGTAIHCVSFNVPALLSICQLVQFPALVCSNFNITNDPVYHNPNSGTTAAPPGKGMTGHCWSSQFQGELPALLPCHLPISWRMDVRITKTNFQAILNSHPKTIYQARPQYKELYVVQRFSTKIIQFKRFVLVVYECG